VIRASVRLFELFLALCALGVLLVVVSGISLVGLAIKR
jgi:hypothetical protein